MYQLKSSEKNKYGYYTNVYVIVKNKQESKQKTEIPLEKTGMKNETKNETKTQSKEEKFMLNKKQISLIRKYKKHKTLKSIENFMVSSKTLYATNIDSWTVLFDIDIPYGVYNIERTIKYGEPFRASIDENDFPSTDNFYSAAKKENETVSADYKQLDIARHFVGTSQDREILQNVFCNNKGTIVASDGVWMYYKNIKDFDKNNDCVISADCVALLNKYPGSKLSVHNKKTDNCHERHAIIQIIDKGIKIGIYYTKITDDPIPDFRQIIPAKDKHVTVNREALLSEIETYYKYTNEKTHHIIFDNGAIRVVNIPDDIDKKTQSVLNLGHETGFDAKRLIQILRFITTGMVTVKQTNQLSPAVFNDEFLLMPLTIKNKDKLK
jgi:hypothetical protein